ncbi:hypothetical protein [Flavobacterium humidisoli]|jgi:ABC-type oligopeptide transport system ATPase subunit|uniref:Addiction module component n=1 Tax=Flavobacterium humidisoli TaxID=2937442 RepID=A0ABY4LMN8_9FLAO|nr:hypothetical protein [Flavobacterium humidisoli]UPZ13893.1 hypothetical protein M0M44_14155 [Flavobacterium humidisoli]
MEAIRLEFQPEIREKVLKLLSEFSPSELTIIEEDSDFENDKRKVRAAYAKLKSGNEKLYSVDEVDSILDNTFSEYDN